MSEGKKDRLLCVINVVLWCGHFQRVKLLRTERRTTTTHERRTTWSGTGMAGKPTEHKRSLRPDTTTTSYQLAHNGDFNCPGELMVANTVYCPILWAINGAVATGWNGVVKWFGPICCWSVGRRVSGQDQRIDDARSESNNINIVLVWPGSEW